MTRAAYPRVSFAAACAAAKGSAFTFVNANSTSRASSPLLFGLAPRGVFRASCVATRAVGSYPTFSPLPNETSCSKTSRRFTCGMPPHCFAGGIFSVALSVNGSASTRQSLCYPNRSPGVTRRVALRPEPAFAGEGFPDGHRTVSGLSSRSAAQWLGRSPAVYRSGTSDHPARPPITIVPREAAYFRVVAVKRRA